MKITDYEKNHGKFVHEDWLQKIINLVPNMKLDSVDMSHVSTIESVKFSDDGTGLTISYKDDQGKDQSKRIDFLRSFGNQDLLKEIDFNYSDTNLTKITLTDRQGVTTALNIDDSIRYAFDNSSDKFIATDKQLGIVKYSKTNPTRVDADGTINTHYDGTGIGLNANHDLSLLPATDTTLGGVMPDGDTIIANDGVLTSLAHYNINANKVVAHALDETITLNATNYIKQLQIAYSGNGEEAFLYVITDVAIDLTTPNTEIASDTPIIGFASSLTAKTNSLIPLVSADKKVYHLYYAYDAAGSKIKTVEPLPANTRFTYVGTV